VFPWVPPNNDRISCYDVQIISGSFSVRALVKPIDNECCKDNEQCANQHGQDDRKDG